MRLDGGEPSAAAQRLDLDLHQVVDQRPREMGGDRPGSQVGGGQLGGHRPQDGCHHHTAKRCPWPVPRRVNMCHKAPRPVPLDGGCLVEAAKGGAHYIAAIKASTSKGFSVCMGAFPRMCREGSSGCPWG